MAINLSGRRVHGSSCSFPPHNHGLQSYRRAIPLLPGWQALQLVCWSSASLPRIAHRIASVLSPSVSLPRSSPRSFNRLLRFVLRYMQGWRMDYTTSGAARTLRCVAHFARTFLYGSSSRYLCRPLSLASSLVAAGTDTVGNTCNMAVFYILSNKDIEKRLRQELKDAWPDVDTPMSLEKLEKLPYLVSSGCPYNVFHILTRTVHRLPLSKNPSASPMGS